LKIQLLGKIRKQRIMRSVIVIILFDCIAQAAAAIRASYMSSLPRPPSFLVQSTSFRRSAAAPVRAERAPAVARATAEEASSPTSKTTRLFPQQYNVLYDSKCGLCNSEINFLRSKDEDAQLLFTDIEDPKYDENDPKNGRLSYEEAMKVIHAVTPDGSLVKGVAVFPAIYKAINYGWVGRWIYEAPVIGPVIEKVSPFWFKYRTLMTRGKTLETLFNERKQCETCAPQAERAAKAAVATEAAKGREMTATAARPSSPTVELSTEASPNILLPSMALIGFFLGSVAAFAAG
jgi:predicted DCC family thiol-disulfide oxidoreductase YuxK